LGFLDGSSLLLAVKWGEEKKIHPSGGLTAADPGTGVRVALSLETNKLRMAGWGEQFTWRLR